MGEKFFEYMNDLNALKLTCEKHFNGAMTNIKQGMLDIKNDKKTAEMDLDFTFKYEDHADSDWNCRLCK